MALIDNKEAGGVITGSTGPVPLVFKLVVDSVDGESPPFVGAALLDGLPGADPGAADGAPRTVDLVDESPRADGGRRRADVGF